MRILLVEDNPGDARLLTIELTEEAGDAFEVEWARDLESALERTEAELFDAILLDLNLPDSEGFATFARVHEAVAGVPILVLTGLEDDTIGLRAIQQGAQDYLSKSELNGSAVSRALRHAVERYQSQLREMQRARGARRGQMVGFIGAKGGVGTTTVALSVAALFSRNTRRTVTAVELRADRGSFAEQLGESPNHTLAHLLRLDPDTLADSVLDKCTLRSRLGFDVVFSPQRAEEFCQLDRARVERLKHLLAHRSACTVLDLPSQFCTITETILRDCDLTILVTERDPSALAAARAALEFLGKPARGSRSTGLVVVNRSMMLDGITPRQIQEELGCELMGVVPPAPEVALSAQRFGLPMALHRPTSAPATMLNAITAKILTRLDAPALVRQQLPAGA